MRIRDAERAFDASIWLGIFEKRARTKDELVREMNKELRDNLVGVDWNFSQYIRDNVPPTAIIAADQRAAMPSADDPRYAGFQNLLPNKILITRYTADLGTIDELLTKGVSYVVVASRDANRLGNEENYSGADLKRLPERRAFYQDLTKRGTVLWQSKMGDNKYLNVSLILYQIAI